MNRLTSTRSGEITAPVGDIWDVLAGEFLEISRWARGVKTSQSNPAATDIPAGAVTGGRICEVYGMGQTDERITHFVPDKHELTYTASASKVPGFVSGAQNAWKIEQIGPTAARVTTEISADLSGIMGTVMAPMLRRNFGKTQDGLIDDLRAYVETGSPSEAKRQRLAKT